MKSVLLNKHSLEIAKLAPKEESRYTLNALRVTEGETMVTNGHYLIRVENPKMKVENFPTVAGDVPAVEVSELLIPTASALEVLKGIPKKDAIPVLNHAKVGKGEDGMIRMVTTDMDVHRPNATRAITGQFPNVDAVMPRSQKFTIGVNAEYLSKLLAIAATYNDRSHFVELSFTDKPSAMRIDAHDEVTGQHFTAVLMLMRGEIEGKPFPPEVIVDPFADVPEPEEVCA